MPSGFGRASKALFLTISWIDTMRCAHRSALEALLESVLGERRAATLLGVLEVPEALDSKSTGRVSRGQLAMGLAALLFEDVIQRVPMARAYVQDARRASRRLCLDHGALRTVAASSGALPSGIQAFTRILEPLGYRRRGEYDLQRLGMTGYGFAHADLPQELPQYFVSELHPERFSPAFQAAVGRVIESSCDPLPLPVQALLGQLEREGELSHGSAVALLPILLACFARQHEEPSLEDYELLRAESPEMAWIATEGNSFNHATDRVADVAAVAVRQRLLGRPIKDELEISRSGRVIQTAFRATSVERLFRDADGNFVVRTVPGSFHEFITRKPLANGELDLDFDVQNAQSIFQMTTQREVAS